MWPPGAAKSRRLLLLNFVEYRKVGTRYMFDLLAERPDVLELAVRRLEREFLGGHGVRQSNERLLDHREPLSDGGSHGVNAFLPNRTSRKQQARSDRKRAYDVWANALPPPERVNDHVVLLNRRGGSR